MGSDSDNGSPARLSEGAALRPIQKRVFAIAALIALMDGFDTQIIAYVGPVIARQWQLSPQQLGPVFGAGMLGLAVGAAVFGPLADRIGRKAVIVVSTFWFGIASLLTALATDVTTLALLRCLTGLGLGGSIPNIIAITAEYSPPHLRGRLIMLMFCGFPVGALSGGLVGLVILPAAPWQWLFAIGGVLPIILAFILIKGLPESLDFLLERRSSDARIETIGRSLGVPINLLRQQRPAAEIRVGFHELFRSGLTWITLLLWTCFFMSLLILYLLINWLPTVLSRADFGLQTSILSTVLLNLGGIVGGIGLARLVDGRGGNLAVAATFLIAALATLALGRVSANGLVVLSLAALAGLGTGGAQLALNAIAARCYPTRIRSTGVGWAFAVGRVGAIVGPLLGGWLLHNAVSQATLFAIAAIPAFIAAAATALLARHRVPGEIAETQAVLGSRV